MINMKSYHKVYIDDSIYLPQYKVNNKAVQYTFGTLMEDVKKIKNLKYIKKVMNIQMVKKMLNYLVLLYVILLIMISIKYFINILL